MPASTGRHVLVQLRKILGMNQSDFAALIEYSPAAIQSIEIGRRAMTEGLAVTISIVTGISTDWLLENDLVRPAVDGCGELYTKGTFELWRAKKTAPASEGLQALMPPLLLGYYAELRRIFDRALEKRTESLAFYKLRKFVEALDEEVTGKNNCDARQWMRRPTAEFALKDAQIALREHTGAPNDQLSAEFAANLKTLQQRDQLEVPPDASSTSAASDTISNPSTEEDYFPVKSTPARSPKTSALPPASPAPSSGGKASSSPRTKTGVTLPSKRSSPTPAKAGSPRTSRPRPASRVRGSA